MSTGAEHTHQTVGRSGPCVVCGAVLCASCSTAIEQDDLFVEVRRRDLVDTDTLLAIHLSCIARASTITYTGLQPDRRYTVSTAAATAARSRDAAGFTPAERVEFEATTAANRAVMEWIDGDPSRRLIGCTPSMVAGVAINAYRKALAR